MKPSAEAFVAGFAASAESNRRTLAKLSGLLARLSELGVEVIAVKGADLATRVYPSVGLRPIGDVDLLAREADLPAIERAAFALGLRRKLDGNAAFIDDQDNFIVDVATKVWYLESEDELWSRSFVQDGLRRLDATDALLFSCLWVCLHRAYFSRAFAEDARRLFPLADRARLLENSRRLGLRMPLRRALEYARLPIDGLEPENVRERLALRLLRRLVTQTRLFGLSHLLVLATRPRGTRLFALRRQLFPDRRFLVYRYGEASLARRLARPFVLAGRGLALLARLTARLCAG